MARRGRDLLLAACAAASLFAVGPARGADEPPGSRLPFSDDVAPPPPLPQPIDRAFKGELVDFDGDRATLRWNWKSADQLADFESFVPVRSTLRGGFVIDKDKGRICADGTAGIRVKLGFLSDLEVHVGSTILKNPHDLGIVLPAPNSSDDSILCLVQDILFTTFDGAAGHTNMINKLGGIASAKTGMVEFRYIARSLEPHLAPNAEVTFDVVRKVANTSFVITPKGASPVTMRGKDTDTPMTRFTPGLYVSGGAADFGQLTIGGALDFAWCADHNVLPYFAGNLLHPGNKWKPPEKKLAEMVERYTHQDPATEKDPKKLVTAAMVEPLVGDVKVPLVIRIRAAEALMNRGEADAVAERLAALLDAKKPARVLAWQLLRPTLPWHFKYEVDADDKTRREAAQLIGAYVRERQANEDQGKIFIEGYWYTPERADDIRSNWDHAWEMRTPQVRLRTNLSGKWAAWYRDALQAEYRELVNLVGHEPPYQNLPLSVFVFKNTADYSAFCGDNGYAAKASWGHFADLDKNVSFSVFDKKDGLANTMGQFAKQFHHFATGKFWPLWYDEGRAAWFGNADYGTVAFDGTTLQVGLVGHGNSVKILAKLAEADKMPAIVDMVAKDNKALSAMKVEDRRIWYVEAWAFHAWLVDHAPDPIRAKFADWQSAMEKLPTTPRDVDDVGLKEFLARFTKSLPDMDREFREWVQGL